MSHAVLAPSAAHRWINCPPSARLEEKFPETINPAAMEGTYAHKLAEIKLQHYFNQLSEEAYKLKYEEMRQRKYYSKGLEEYVEVYVEEVISKYFKSKEEDKGAAVLLEQKVDLTRYVPEGYGHADAIIISDGTMEICDLKYGAGVKVEAKKNPQLRLYALGAYSELSFLYEIKNVAMTIVQPRNGGITSEKISVPELLEYGEKVKEIAKLAYAGLGEYKAGEHCKFCKAANMCKKYAEYQQEAVKEEFDDPDLLNDSEIVEILKKADSIIKWLGNVKEYALKEAVENGKRWKGFKLVEGRSVRKIADENKAAEILKSEGGQEEEIWKPREILGITALEKNFGKKKIAEWLSEVIVKPPGSPVLVPESDKRMEWQKAENDFDNIVENEKTED